MTESDAERIVEDAACELVTVTLPICRMCLAGLGPECHVPGCAFWMHPAPTGSTAAMLRFRAYGYDEDDEPDMGQP